MILLVSPPVAAQECAYVANTNFDDIAVLNLDANELAASIPVGRAPVAVAISPDGSTGYAVNDLDHSVSIFSTATRQVTTTIDLRCFDNIRVGCNPVDVAFGPSGAHAYVANLRSNNLAVIDTATRQVLHTLPAGGEGPSSVALSADERTAFTTHLFANTIGVIDIEQRRARTIRVGNQPFDLALHPDGQSVYVVNSDSGSVSVVRLADSSVVATLPVGGFPSGIAFDPRGRYVYVATGEGGTVVVIDTTDNSLLRSIDIEGVAADVGFSSSRSRAYVSEFVLGNVFVLDTTTYTRTHSITIGGGAASQRLAIAAVPDGCPLPPTPTATPTMTVTPTPTTTPTGRPAPALLTDLDAEERELSVSRPDAFPAYGTLRIGNELLTYSGKAGNRLLQLVRGAGGSSAMAHAAGATVDWVGMRGDANCDGVVTVADVAAWIEQRAEGSPGICGGDFDGNGRVDDADLEPLLGSLFTLPALH